MGMTKADSVTREIYADVLGENNDPAMVRLVQDLEWGYTSVTVPPAVRSKPPRPAPGQLPELRRTGSTWTDMPRRWRLHTKLYAALGVVVTGAILLATGVSLAGPTQDSITNLGPPLPMQSTNAGFPLSGFHRTSPFLHANGRPELLFIGTLAAIDAKSAIERWPVVKALEQFGSLMRVKALDAKCLFIGIPCVPTFDWSHASYRSRYLSFVHKDLFSSNAKGGAYYQRLSPAEIQLYNKYSRRHGARLKNDPLDVSNTILQGQNPTSTHDLPLIVIGGYLQTLSQVTISGDFQIVPTESSSTPQVVAPPSTPLSFAQVRESFARGKDPAGTHLIEDVNAEANIITALICHATKDQPKSVCSRPTIRQILKHVK